MRYTVNRGQWVRGRLGGESLLLNDRGNKCCLGFVALQDGFYEDDLAMIAEPSSMDLLEEHLGMKTAFGEVKLSPSCPPDDLFSFDSGRSEDRLVFEAIRINDNASINEFSREYLLRRLFLEHGHAIVFTGRTEDQL